MLNKMDFMLIVHVPTSVLHVILIQFGLTTLCNVLPEQQSNDFSYNLFHGSCR